MKKRTRLLGLLLALALCLSGLSVTAYAADSVNYLALGDSITTYDGLSSSSDGFVDKLAKEISATTKQNLGVSGQTTSELLSALNNNTTYQLSRQRTSSPSPSAGMI